MKTAKVILLAGVLGASGVKGEDWAQWRGPDANGISKESLEGSTALETAWKAEVGLGFSGFVVADGRVFTIGHNGTDTDTVWCLDAETGKVVWKHSYPQALGDKYFPGGSTGTPTVDGDVLYSLARGGGIVLFRGRHRQSEVAKKAH